MAELRPIEFDVNTMLTEHERQNLVKLNKVNIEYDSNIQSSIINTSFSINEELFDKIVKREVEKALGRELNKTPLDELRMWYRQNPCYTNDSKPCFIHDTTVPIQPPEVT